MPSGFPTPQTRYDVGGRGAVCVWWSGVVGGVPGEMQRKRVRKRRRRHPEAPCCRAWTCRRSHLFQPLLTFLPCRRDPFSASKGTPLPLRLAPRLWGRQLGDPGMLPSGSRELRRLGAGRGAGSRGVVTAPAPPLLEAPLATAVNAPPSDGPGPAPGRRALPARGGVCCFCSQRESERYI